MTTRVDIGKHPELRGNVRSLPSSKSMSNRALIINALGQNQGVLQNLSSARDTELMQRLIATPDHVIDVMDAGTTMRFLTAYFALTNQKKTITGTARMKERPIHLLVDALRKIGAMIDYVERDGFAPLHIRGFDRQLAKEISIRGDVSSQFISALMMTAPALPQGLVIRLEGKIASLPYLKMTAELMKRFGVMPRFGPDQIQIPSSRYTAATYRVEPDWSAASYWFAFVALAKTADLLLPDVDSAALQGDRVIVEIMDLLGVQSDFIPQGLRLTKKPISSGRLVWNFSNCPDLAQTVLPVCAALGITGEFTGLESLRIKETDRIAALQEELSKIGAKLTETGSAWHLIPGTLPKTRPVFKTYHDHRMAMGLAPLAALMDIGIDSPEVVNKSYPTFWQDMQHLGFNVQGAGT